MISLELLSAVLGFKIIPVNGKDLREKSFGYEQGLRTTCISPLKDNEWISLSDNIIHFGYKDMRPEVLINIPEGVYTTKKINIYELAHKCKEWAETVGDGYSLTSSTTDEYNMIGCEYSQWMCEIVYHPNDTFYANTEPKAIFIACQYILDEQQKLKLRMQPTKGGD